jgi:hypothetical protein
MSDRWKILVIWLDGDQEYLKDGKRPDGAVATFSREAADRQRDFMLAGMSDEVQSINVVRSGEVSNG